MKIQDYIRQKTKSKECEIIVAEVLKDLSFTLDINFADNGWEKLGVKDWIRHESQFSVAYFSKILKEFEYWERTVSRKYDPDEIEIEIGRKVRSGVVDPRIDICFNQLGLSVIIAVSRDDNRIPILVVNVVNTTSSRYFLKH